MLEARSHPHFSQHFDSGVCLRFNKGNELNLNLKTKNHDLEKKRTVGKVLKKLTSKQ